MFITIKMAKRFIDPQRHGERKKPKLDVSLSDHNFPLGQNPGFKESDNWGDDNDDEILLLASQACEEAYSNNDISALPDYSHCMQPKSTSTQLFEPFSPSTSKDNFNFKRPTPNVPNLLSTHMKDKYNRISSPLPGISSKVLPKVNGHSHMDNDFTDKIYKGQDVDHIYEQLLKLQEENTKLKSENGKLLEKCVTKEGEASILRTQLKTCQSTVDNARLETIKAQEKVQVEYSDKLSKANVQIHDLRTQLDFKNLEIISIKEKCKMLESTKVKLTQVTVNNHDTSYRNSNLAQNDSRHVAKRVKTVSNEVQTENNALFLKLNGTEKPEIPNINEILPFILEPTMDQHCILEYNEKLRRSDFSDNKCRIFSTFHRLPCTPVSSDVKSISSLSISNVYEDISNVLGENLEMRREKYDNIILFINSGLNEVVTQLEEISKRMTTTFQKEMDEKYIDAVSSFIQVDEKQLFCGRVLYKEEQAILARRVTAVLAYIQKFMNSTEELFEGSLKNVQIVAVISRICNLVSSTYSAVFYSGLLLSIILVLKHIFYYKNHKTQVIQIIQNIITSRPMPFVMCHLLNLLRQSANLEYFKGAFCPDTSSGNLKLDYDQGVLLFKKDSCYIQVVLKQVEAALKCIERQNLENEAVLVTRNLILMYINSDHFKSAAEQNTQRCECATVFLQVIVYALRICAVMANIKKEKGNLKKDRTNENLLAVCRAGTQILFQSSVRDVDFSTQLLHNEGHLMHFCDLMNTFEHSETYRIMLSELAGTFQCVVDQDTTPSYNREAWVSSFESFSITD